MIRSGAAALAVLASVAFAGDAAAQLRLRADGEPAARNAGLDDLSLNLTAPPSVDDFSFTPPPTSPNWQDSMVLQSLRGFEAELLRGSNYAAGLSARSTPGRGDRALLTGRAEPGFEFGAFGELFFDKWTVAARFGQDRADGIGGFVADLGVRWASQILDGVTVEFGSELSWADAGYTARYFGGDGPLAASPGLRLYDPSPGLKDLTVSGAVSYAIGDSWTVGGIIGAQRMLGDAAGSPLVKDPNEYFGGLSLDYRF